MIAPLRFLLLVMLLVATSVGAAYAQTPDSAEAGSPTLRVGLYVSPPFVMEAEDGYTGMAIELWEGMADDLGLTYRYEVFPTFTGLVSATETSSIDVAVTNLTITRDRAERIEFTHPWFDAGLRIMVHDEAGASFSSVIQGLSTSGHLRAYAWIGGVIVLATLILTLFDRRFDKNFPKGWRDGVAESFYSVMSVATSGRSPSRKNLFGWVGRIWQALWLVCGVAVLAYVTSSVTSVMTTLALTSDINEVEDLPGKSVAAFEGSVGEGYAQMQGLRPRAFANVDRAVDALIAGRVDAIIADAPVLEYHAHTHPEQPVSVVGAIFEPDKYGFGLPDNSPLVRPLTIALIGAHEGGEIEAIRARYFAE